MRNIHRSSQKSNQRRLQKRLLFDDLLMHSSITTEICLQHIHSDTNAVTRKFWKFIFTWNVHCTMHKHAQLSERGEWVSSLLTTHRHIIDYSVPKGGQWLSKLSQRNCHSNFNSTTFDNDSQWSVLPIYNTAAGKVGHSVLATTCNSHTGLATWQNLNCYTKKNTVSTFSTSGRSILISRQNRSFRRRSPIQALGLVWKI